MTFAIILYNVYDMNQLTQSTKQVMHIIYDRIHVIFILVVRIKHFPLYIEGVWIEIIIPMFAFFYFFLIQHLLHCSWDMNSAIRQMHCEFINEQ